MAAFDPDRLARFLADLRDVADELHRAQHHKAARDVTAAIDRFADPS